MARKVFALILGARTTSGGANDYEARLTEVLRNLSRDSSSWSLRVFRFAGTGHPFELAENSAGKPVPYSEKSLPSVRFGFRGLYVLRQSPAQRFENFLVDEGVSLVYFASVNRSQSHFVRLPFISTIWDIGHRNLPEFPEFRGRHWFEMEKLLSSSLPRAFHVITDSKLTGKRIGEVYGVEESRTSSIGLLAKLDQTAVACNHAKALERKPFFIYPAKMWAHKNHSLLLRAFAKVVSQFPEARLVFTGHHEGAVSEKINAEIIRLRLEERVHNFGYLEMSCVQALIESAVALVMPSEVGPTNIPPLQALGLGTPAIVSGAHNYGGPIQGRLVVVENQVEEDWAFAMLQELSAPRRIEPEIFSDYDATHEIRRVLELFLRRLSAWE